MKDCKNCRLVFYEKDGREVCRADRGLIVYVKRRELKVYVLTERVQVCKEFKRSLKSWIHNLFNKT